MAGKVYTISLTRIPIGRLLIDVELDHRTNHHAGRQSTLASWSFSIVFVALRSRSLSVGLLKMVIDDVHKSMDHGQLGTDAAAK